MRSLISFVSHVQVRGIEVMAAGLLLRARSRRLGLCLGQGGGFSLESCLLGVQRLRFLVSFMRDPRVTNDQDNDRQN